MIRYRKSHFHRGRQMIRSIHALLGKYDKAVVTKYIHSNPATLFINIRPPVFRDLSMTCCAAKNSNDRVGRNWEKASCDDKLHS